MIKENRIFLTLLLLSVFAVPSFAGTDPERAYIEWKPTAGALSYVVEIVDVFGELILEKKTEAAKLEVSLPYGKYKYRVGMFTKFNKVSGWSDWKTLMIVPALEPKILSATPANLSTVKDNSVTIKGKNFYRSSQVSIKNTDTALEVKNVKLIDPETLSVTVDAAKAKAGTRYDLVVENPGDLLDPKAVAANQFTVMEKPSVEKYTATAMQFFPGIEAGYYTPDLGKDDAYSGAMGVKLFCEFRSIGMSHPKLSFLNKAPGFYPGVLLSVFGFLNPKPGYGSSTMMQLGIYFGYDFPFPLKGEYKVHVSPVIGYKQYFRWHTYRGEEFFGSRPILLLGGTVDFDLPMKFFIGLTLEYNAVFDVQPVNLLGVFVRCGYRL
jgi:hypothetical protein